MIRMKKLFFLKINELESLVLINIKISSEVFKIIN